MTSIRLAILLTFSTSLTYAAPVITSIVNAYSFISPDSPNYGIAQGSIFLITGTDLAPGTTPFQNVPLGYRLDGVVVQVSSDNYENVLPLYSISPTQIIAVLNSDVPVGPQSIALYDGRGHQAIAKFTVVPSAFGILTRNRAGSGPAAAVDGRANAVDADNSTRPGDIVQIFGSGVGAVTGNEYVQQEQINLTHIPMTAEIGGVPAEILYRGRTIYPGLDQINIRVPSLAPGAFGCSVPIVIKSGGISSNTATIAITPSGGVCATAEGALVTQAEIDRWTAAGTYTTGTVVVRGDTFFDVPSSLVDTYAEFRRISGPELGLSLREITQSPADLAGKCRLGSGPYPNITSTDLDAGPSIRTDGPAGIRVSPKGIDHYNRLSYFSSGVPGAYPTEGRYTVSGSGGADVGGFFGDLVVPAPLIWTNTKESKSVIRANGLTIRWTGGDPTQLVYISGTSNFYMGVVASRVFHCHALNTAGEFTVPAELLNQLSPSSGYAYVYVASTSRPVRLKAPGVDYLTAVSAWGYFLRVEYK